MTEKRFALVLDDDYGDVLNDNITGDAYGFEREYRISIVELLNMLHEENQSLKKENKRLHTRIFEMRTKRAYDRTAISDESFTEKEFLDELEKW